VDISSKRIGELALVRSESWTLLVEPKVADAETVAKHAFSHGRTLIAVGKCWVRYVGRASSKLEKGDRILIAKADGSVLVHRGTGYEPVNWMPGGDTVFHVHLKDSVLEVRAVRHRPSESVTVLFDEVSMVYSFKLVDSGEFSLYASEEDMHRALLLRPELLEEGFRVISYEKRVEPGFVDIYGIDRVGRLVVVEVKRKTAGKDAALQLAKYIEAVRSKADRQVRGVLAAPNIAKDVQRTLVTLGLEFKCLDPKKCAETLSRAETRKLAEFFE